MNVTGHFQTRALSFLVEFWVMAECCLRDSCHCEKEICLFDFAPEKDAHYCICFQSVPTPSYLFVLCITCLGLAAPLPKGLACRM